MDNLLDREKVFVMFANAKIVQKILGEIVECFKLFSSSDLIQCNR
jgi:hypothetical protein